MRIFVGGAECQPSRAFASSNPSIHFLDLQVYIFFGKKTGLFLVGTFRSTPANSQRRMKSTRYFSGSLQEYASRSESVPIMC